MENFDKLRSKCVSAYTYVQLMGQYAADQLEDAIECEPNLENVQFLCSTTKIFLKNMQQKLDLYLNDIGKFTDLLKTKPLVPVADDSGSSVSTLVADVRDIKAESTKLLTLKRCASTEENTDDDVLEMYRNETIIENNTNEKVKHNIDENKEDGKKAAVDSGDDKSDTTICSFRNEDQNAMEVLEALGCEDDVDMDSLSDMSSDDSRLLSPLYIKRSVSPTSSSEHSTALSSYRYTEQDYRDIYNVKQCFVLLENIDNKATTSKQANAYDREMQEISRLTNEDTLEKIGSSTKKYGVCSEKGKRKRDDESSITDSESEKTSDTDEDDLLKEISNVNLTSPSNEDEDLDDDLEDLLSKLGESDAEEEENNIEDKVKDPDKIGKPKKEDRKRKHCSGSEDEHKRWRRDPLLTARLASPLSGEETEELTSTKAEKEQVEQEDVSDDDKKNLTKIEDISESDTESDDCTRKKKKKRPFLPNERVFISSSDSSDDSDCEFVGSIPKIEDGDKGRKNIRAIKSKESLEKGTQDALRLEEERINRVNEQKKKLSQTVSHLDETEGGLVLDIDKETLKPSVVVDSTLTNKLKDHQKEGIQFMWNNCYESVERLKTSQGTGCILAHCMGLGKTLQAIALIHTVFKHQVTKTKHVLIVCPLSTVVNWKSEFKAMLKDVNDIKINVKTISDRRTKVQKSITVSSWYAAGGVLILGYECFAWLVKEFMKDNSSNTNSTKYKALLAPGPDLIICDEGHLIRNKKNCRTKALAKIKTKRRILLTGTPLQNNLEELYQMVQFVKPNLLGTRDEFMNRFGNPIINGGYFDSTARDIKLMQRRSHVLHTYLKETVQRYEVSELKKYLPEKIEYVIFVTLHPIQVELYKDYLELTNTAAPLTNKRFLSDYVALRNVWSHPRTLVIKEKEQTPKAKENPKENDDVILADNTTQRIQRDWYHQKSPSDIHSLEIGPKFLVLMSIIEECEKVGDKILIFSSFLANLDTIEYFLQTHGTSKCKSWAAKLDYLRIDGSMALDVRNEYCNMFMRDDKIRVFLLSHRVGGMGLNLFAANRIILMDVSFNPAMDDQSVYRIYRFGQEKKCYIYRLVAMGTMEETVYERSVTKSAISARVVDEQQIQRHFKRGDLEQMYRFKDCSGESRPVPRVPKDVVLANILHKHKEVFKYHDYHALLENQLDEQLDEQEQQAAWEEFRVEQEQASATKLLNETRGALNVSSSIQTPYDPKISATPLGGQTSLIVNNIPNTSTSISFASLKSNEVFSKLQALYQENQSTTRPNILCQEKKTSSEKQTNSHPLSATKTSVIQQRPSNNQPSTKPTSVHNGKQTNDPTADDVVVLVNDEIIQSGNDKVSLPKDSHKTQHGNLIKKSEPVKKLTILPSLLRVQHSVSQVQKPSQTSQTLSKAQLLQAFHKQSQNAQQKPSQKPVIKAVDLDTLVEKVRKQVGPDLLQKLVSVVRATPTNGEDAVSITKENSNGVQNQRNSVPPIALPPIPGHVPPFTKESSVDNVGPSTSASHHFKSNSNTNKSQSQQSQNPIVYLVSRTDKNRKKKDDVIEID